ncbi:MAG TPA: bile acid:sodium symporter family protein [Opitutaceae bacterium]|nr:bile acid:sodium symporter family protein [Opitutaceae bacterium]
MIVVRKFFLGLAALALVALIAGLVTNNPTWWQPAAVSLALGVAIGLGAIPALKGYQYTAWIIAAVVAAMIYPASFLHWGDLNLRNKYLLLVVVQLVMFGMGTQMSLRDFAGVMKMPWGVFVAVAGQFLIMPLSGFLLTKVFPLPDEIAAGVILIGACSSGLASNVMCYIAKANLALSITATSVTTLLAPFLTPMWMKVLAGELVEVKFFNMMLEIFKIVIVPIGAALLHDYLKHASAVGRRRVAWLAAISAVVCGYFLSGWSPLNAPDLSANTRAGLELGGFACGAWVFGWAYHALTRQWASLDARMPLISMAGIVYFTTVTTAAGRDSLLMVGGLLFLVAVLHNAAGYFFGYWLARACRLDKASCRTVAIEVGLQNGGMASGLAAAMGRLGTVGLAAAVFSPWMNISGSILANYWKRRPADERSTKEPQ